MNRGPVCFHFDPHHQVRDYVAAVLNSLQPHANHILLVSNSPVSKVGRARLVTHCDEILPRPNEGLDVSAYRTGLEHLGWERLTDFDELTLANHTYYAPLRPQGEVLTRAVDWGDISSWGMTEHATMRPHPLLAQRELLHHLQFHWIAVRRRLLTDLASQEYWEQMPPVSFYRDSIQWHESRFTDHSVELGHTWQAAFLVNRYRSGNPAIEEAPALLADGCPLLKRRALFHDPLYQDRQAVVGGELLRTTARANCSEGLILFDVVRTAAARNLIVNAGPTEVVTGCVPGAAGAGAETSLPERRPMGCVVVHVPAGREALERAGADGLVQRLAGLSTHWRVVVTSPKRLNAANLERVASRRPSQEDTQEDSVHEGGDVSFHLVRDLDPRGTITFLTQCDNLWDPGRAAGGGGSGDSDPLVLRATVGLPPIPGTRADDVAHRRALDCLPDSPGYTASLIDLLAHHPDLGVAVSAAGHIGQVHGEPTWGGLADAAKTLSRRFDLSTELNPLAPVAPPGTVFMTRPEALYTLSEGAKELVRLTDQAAVGTEQFAERLRHACAAEVLELLAVYAAMSSNLHPREVLTPVWAGRLYGTLAYRRRVVTADLPTHTDEQVRFLQARFGPLAGAGTRVRTYVDVHHPNMGSALKPTYRYLTSGASGLTRAATSTGGRLRGIGRHREEDKGD